MKRRCCVCDKVATWAVIERDRMGLDAFMARWRYACSFHARRLLDVDPDLYVLPLRKADDFVREEVPMD